VNPTRIRRTEPTAGWTGPTPPEPGGRDNGVVARQRRKRPV
jgi:hypothetical protein